MIRSVPRTYLFALVDGGGTVPPELGVARRLIERGHHVTVLGEDSMASDVRAIGARFRPWTTAPNRPDRRPEHDPYRDWECRSPFQLFARLMDLQFVGPARAYAADVADAVAERRPDLVLCSFMAYGAMVGAEATGVPFDVLMPNAYMLPVRGMPPFGVGAPPAKGPLGRLRDRALTRVIVRQWDKGLPALNELRADLGLDPLGSFFEQAHRARRHLVLTSAAFDLPADLPDNARYLGPVLDDPTWTAGQTWDEPPGDDPLVLVGLSSTFQDQVDCLQRIVDALATMPVRGLVTTGPAFDPQAIRAPANVTVVAAAPHSEILGRAAAVITHGGHGTAIRALAADVPMVVMHHGRDQADNARRITLRGAGVSVKRTAAPAAIAGALRRVLDDPGYREGAARLGAAIRSDVASGRLVAAVEDVPETGISVST